MKSWLMPPVFALALAAASGGAVAEIHDHHKPVKRVVSVDLSHQLRQNSFVDAVNDPKNSFDPAKTGRDDSPPPDRTAAPMTVSARAVGHGTVESLAAPAAGTDNWATILIGLLGAGVIARRRISSV